jgi:hypothetical protein
MYTLQGKIRPTRHIHFSCQSTYIRRTLPMGGPCTWQPSTSHRQSWTESLLLRKRAPDTIHSTTANRSAGPYPVSLLSQQCSSEESQTCVDSRLLGLPDPYHRHVIGTFNTCSWVPTPRNSHNTLPTLPL